MAESWVSFGASPQHPWWLRNTFRFVPPPGGYDPLLWRQAVFDHAVMQDAVAFLRYCISGSVPYFMQVHLDEPGQWFPLASMLRALDLEAPPDDLLPLPQPRPVGSVGLNPWLVTLPADALDEARAEPVYIPFGLVATRLLPLRPRPVAQVVSVWLLYRVLPVCARSGGPVKVGPPPQPGSGPTRC